MYVKCFFSICLIWFSFSTVNGQTTYTLEACIKKAIATNLQIQNSEIALDNARLDIKLAQHSRFPNLSFNSNVGWNFGRTVDPTQNLFTTETFFNNSASLSSNVILYNGNKINNMNKQSVANLKAAEKDLEQTQKDISLQVSSVYLNILFAKENLQNAQNQLNQTKDQLSLLQKQIAVGNMAENDRFEIEAQIAVNEQTVIENKNILQLQLLNLKQLMRSNPDEDIDIAVTGSLSPSTDPDLISFDYLFETAKSNQATVMASEWRMQSAAINEKIAQAEAIPSLVAGGNLRTNYSNKGYNISGYNREIVEQDIIFNNQPVTIGFPQNIPVLEKTPYLDQFNNNLSYGVGISLNIPIYSNYSIKANQQKAKLNLERAKIGYEQTVETLKTSVAQAYADARSSKMRFNATEKTKNAQSVVYNNALKRFELGATSVFELSRLKTILESAEINHLVAKYDYIFRTRVLDYYLGKPINLN